MKIKNVGNGLDHSAKKILSLLLSVVMLCTMFTAFGLTANAAGETPIEISDFATLKSTIYGATAGTPLEIDITADIMSGGNVYINYGKDITINLNSHTVECTFYSYDGVASTLTLNGSGTVKGMDGEYGLSCAVFQNGSTLIANNVKFLGGKATSENGYSGYGLIIENVTARLNNCYVSAGQSNDTADNLSAISSGGTAKIYAKNCTFVRGTGGSGQDFYTVYNIVYNLDTEEKIEIADIYQSPIVIGKDFAFPVTGDTITDTDGSPARADSPITATTTIPEPTYTVTIPASVDFGALTQALEKYRDKATDKNGEINPKKAFNVSASGVDNMFDGNKLFVTIGTTVNLSLENGTKTVPCKLYKGDSEYTVGSDFAVFHNDIQLKTGEKNEQSGAISVNRCDLTEQGNYKGTITFNIEIKGAN